MPKCFLGACSRLAARTRLATRGESGYIAQSTHRALSTGSRRAALVESLLKTRGKASTLAQDARRVLAKATRHAACLGNCTSFPAARFQKRARGVRARRVGAFQRGARHATRLETSLKTRYASSKASPNRPAPARIARLETRLKAHGATALRVLNPFPRPPGPAPRDLVNWLKTHTAS